MEGSSHVISGSENSKLSWWERYGYKSVCVLAALGAVICGLIRIISFTPLCLIAGLFLMVHGALIIVVEFPFSCKCFEFTEPFTGCCERCGPFMKSLVYALPAFIPLAFCFSVTTGIGCILLVACGAVLAFNAIRRK